MFPSLLIRLDDTDEDDMVVGEANQTQTVAFDVGECWLMFMTKMSETAIETEGGFSERRCGYMKV